MSEYKYNATSTKAQEIPTRPTRQTSLGKRPAEENYGRRLNDATIISSVEDTPCTSLGCIVAVIPAYNEERFIGSVVLKTKQVANTVIVVDDGSSDGTAEMAAAAGAVVVKQKSNLGKGSALSTGFQVARNYHPDAIVCLDADGQHRPDELSAVCAPILAGEADLVIGSRYLGDASDVPRHRVWGHWGFNLMTRLASGVAASDSQSGYRAFSPKVLTINGFSSGGFSVESEMQFIANEHDLRLVEVPITIHYSDKPKRNVMVHGASVLNGLLRLVGQYRPLLFFGVPGMVLLLGGIGWGWMVVDIFRRSQELAVGYAMISMLLTILGSLAMTTGLILHSIRSLLVEMIWPNLKGRTNT